MIGSPRRLSLWLLALVVASVLMDRLGAAALEQVLLASEFRYSKLYRGGNDSEILLFGDSRAVNGLAAPLIGELSGSSALNLAYVAVSSNLAEIFFSDYLERNRKPRMVVLEVTCVLEGDQAVNELRPYALTSDALRLQLREVNPRAAIASQVSHLFLFNGEILVRALYFMRRSDQSWAYSARLGERIWEARDTLPSFELPLDRARLEGLRGTVQLARSRGIPIRLIVTPWAPHYARKISNLDAWVRAIESATGVEVADYSRAYDDQSLFEDYLHLNAAGRERLARDLHAAKFFD